MREKPLASASSAHSGGGASAIHRGLPRDELPAGRSCADAALLFIFADARRARAGLGPVQRQRHLVRGVGERRPVRGQRPHQGAVPAMPLQVLRPTGCSLRLEEGCARGPMAASASRTSTTCCGTARLRAARASRCATTRTRCAPRGRAPASAPRTRRDARQVLRLVRRVHRLHGPLERLPGVGGERRVRREPGLHAARVPEQSCGVHAGAPRGERPPRDRGGADEDERVRRPRPQPVPDLGRA